MASKSYKLGVIIDPVAKTVRHSGQGYTHCPNPKCEKPVPSRKLKCDHCGKTRTPQSQLTQTVNKIASISARTHNAVVKELAKVRKELDQAVKAQVRAERELAKKEEILGWISNKAAQHS